MGAIPNTQNARLDSEVPVTIDDLIIVRKGGSNGNAGTWIHPKLRRVFSRWMSKESDINDN
jgi:hypothetical protein